MWCAAHITEIDIFLLLLRFVLFVFFFLILFIQINQKFAAMIEIQSVARYGCGFIYLFYDIVTMQSIFWHLSIDYMSIFWLSIFAAIQYDG